MRNGKLPGSRDIHLTIDANGDVTVVVEDVRQECRGLNPCVALVPVGIEDDRFHARRCGAPRQQDLDQVAARLPSRSCQGLHGAFGMPDLPLGGLPRRTAVLLRGWIV
jgi:hypothetical protein